ncbi:hypothetical protein JGU66_29655 [Myxococcaceae bacterium JPH2]|nr:hypothetical protein [Myxococcaceae bacterium JPH2]
MRRTRAWAAWMLALAGLGLGCGRGPEGPSARDREGRSRVLNNFLAARQKVDADALKAAGPALLGQDAGACEAEDSPAPSEELRGRVTWVGDDELLFRDTTGVEHEVLVAPRTRIHRRNRPVLLRELSEGQEVRVAFNVTSGGWMAREVEIVPANLPPASGEPEHPMSRP